jgi:hypothetical protein
MKLYAQLGAQLGSKLLDAVTARYVNGAIFSPKDISGERLAALLAELIEAEPGSDRIFDPQYYACTLPSTGETRLGFLSEDYSSYFAPRRLADLRREANIRRDIRNAVAYQASLPLTHLVSPNILISRSFDSREAAIAEDFIQLTREESAQFAEGRPVLASLIVSREALLDRRLLEEFSNEITGLGSPPDGFYLLVAVRSSEIRSDIYNSDVIGAWMYLNHVLSINGYEVVNGYSDVLSPLLGAAGASAGATGWWSNLRSFSLQRFGPSPKGGRLPIQRYLSLSLLNRITFAELDQLREMVPEVLNGLDTDSIYEGDGSEPQRNREVLQTWQATSVLCQRLSGDTVRESLGKCVDAVQRARDCYGEVRAIISLDQKSNDEHLDAMEYGIRSFEEIAELGPSRED